MINPEKILREKSKMRMNLKIRIKLKQMIKQIKMISQKESKFNKCYFSIL